MMVYVMYYVPLYEETTTTSIEYLDSFPLMNTRVDPPMERFFMGLDIDSSYHI